MSQIKTPHELGIEKMIHFTAAGYAGILPNGNIVDRRVKPLAYPIGENTFLGIIKPKQVTYEQHEIQVDDAGQYDKGYVMSIEDEDGYEYEGIGWYSCGKLVDIEVHDKSENPLPIELRTITPTK